MSNNTDKNTSKTKVDNDSPKEVRNFDTGDLKEFEKEAEKERSRKPGSQSNSSDQHNNGRGGGK